MLRIEIVRHDGLEFPVQIRGRSSDALLFLPGMGVHPSHYRAGLDRLALHLTVVCPDLSFGSNRVLPRDLDSYLSCVEATAARFAPGATRTGHSLGGLLAILGDPKGIGLSPMIPLPLTWPGQFWRAVRLQLREYVGIEGRRGVRWAVAILRDYALMTVRGPGRLFPAVSTAHRTFDAFFQPASPDVRLVLGHYDQLYRREEYCRYAALSGLGEESLKWLPRGHDWPVTHPELLEHEVLEAMRVRAPTVGTSDQRWKRDREMERR